MAKDDNEDRDEVGKWFDDASETVSDLTSGWLYNTPSSHDDKK